MSNSRFLLAMPAVLLAAGLYLVGVFLSTDAEEAAALGHQMPARFLLMLGGILVFGAFAVSIEIFSKLKKSRGATSVEEPPSLRSARD